MLVAVSRISQEIRRRRMRDDFWKSPTGIWQRSLITKDQIKPSCYTTVHNKINIFSTAFHQETNPHGLGRRFAFVRARGGHKKRHRTNATSPLEHPNYFLPKCSFSYISSLKFKKPFDQNLHPPSCGSECTLSTKDNNYRCRVWCPP
jgi:hypothetical protein